eukprot:1893073-Pyramimonas_sp.AAC.1
MYSHAINILTRTLRMYTGRDHRSSERGKVGPFQSSGGQERGAGSQHPRGPCDEGREGGAWATWGPSIPGT